MFFRTQVNGMTQGGMCLLEMVTPVMLRNAIEAHGSIDKIHGFTKFLSENAKLRAHVLTTLRDIARSGGAKTKKKGKATKGKKAKRGAAEDDVDEMTDLLEMAALSLDDILKRKYKEAKQGGQVMQVDMSDDDEEDEEEEEEEEEEVEPKFEMVSTTVADGESDDESLQSYSKGSTGIDRPVASGDLIWITWEGDEAEYLCLVADRKGGGFEITSSDLSFTDTLEFDPDEDVWRFAEGNTKAKPKKKDRVIGADPELLRQKAIASTKPAAVNALADLKFVITGMTEEMPREEFGTYACGLIEGAGGLVRTSVSGKTDYLVCGTIHYNPFTSSMGPIESGSKYKKAQTSSNCSIIDLQQLEEMIASAGGA
jgi:NAD-dependent DNA ligase